MNDKDKDKDILVIAHGDFDGIASVVLLLKRLDISVEKVEIVFTQPFLVDKVKIPDDIEKVYVVDLAANNRNPEMTERFIESLGDRLVEWCDHHEGWSKKDDDRFVIHPTAPACAVILGSGMPPRISYLQETVNDAIAADTRKGEMSETGQLIERAVKSDMGNDALRVAAVWLLMGDESQRPILETAAKAYAAIVAETQRLAGFYHIDGSEIRIFGTRNFITEDEEVAGRDYPGKVAVVDVPDTYAREYGQELPPGHDYDLTQLLLAGQELASFAVVKTVSPHTGEEMVTIATKSKTNLVELFGLPSGAPFRVSLPADRLEDVVEKLHNLEA